MTETLVFIGDSITDAGRRDDADGLGDGYVRLVAEALAGREPRPAIVNTGVGGHRARDLRARWRQDALDHEPTVLTVYVGINDTWRRYDAGEHIPVEAFEADYRNLLLTASDVGVPGLVLVEPYVTPLDDDQRRWSEDLDPKREAVARLAVEFGATFVPLHTIMNDAAAGVEPGALAWDGVHPTPAGARVIADAWLRAYGELDR